MQDIRRNTIQLTPPTLADEPDRWHALGCIDYDPRLGISKGLFGPDAVIGPWGFPGYRPPPDILFPEIMPGPARPPEWASPGFIDSLMETGGEQPTLLLIPRTVRRNGGSGGSSTGDPFVDAVLGGGLIPANNWCPETKTLKGPMFYLSVGAAKSQEVAIILKQRRGSKRGHVLSRHPDDGERKRYYRRKRKRSIVEGKLNEMKRIHGFIQARYYGINKVIFQAFVTGIVINLKRVVTLLTDHTRCVMV